MLEKLKPSTITAINGKVTYVSPLISTEPTFGEFVCIGNASSATSVLIGRNFHCPSCGDPLSDRSGYFYCRNRNCCMRNLKQGR